MISRLSQLKRKAIWKSKLAGLQEDMANRIMYSIIPYVSSQAEIVGTRGVVDIKALKKACEGRKNLIKYGMQAIGKELRHYQEVSAEPAEKAKDNFFTKMIQEGNEKALDYAIEKFADDYSWSPNFGGLAWEKIAKTLRQIVRLDNGLEKVRESRDRKSELQIIKDLVVEMNIFDGLVHNTAKVMESLIKAEDTVLDNEKDPNNRLDHMARFKRRQKLLDHMDAKELENPIDVYKQIRQTLEDSGDIHHFKDHVTKIRNHPDYLINRDISKELALIQVRKRILEDRMQLRLEIDEIKIKQNPMDMYHIWFDIGDLMMSICSLITDYDSDSYHKYTSIILKKLNNIRSAFDVLRSEFVGLKGVIERDYDYYGSKNFLATNNSPRLQSLLDRAKAHSEKLLSLAQKFAFAADTI